MWGGGGEAVGGGGTRKSAARGGRDWGTRIPHDIFHPPTLRYLLFCRTASANDDGGASRDSADNPTGYSTNSDNAVRSNRDIHSNSPDNNQGSNTPVDLRISQSGHLLSQVVE